MDENSRRYAGFWIRAFAAACDLAVLGLFGYIVFGREVTDISSFGYDLSANMTYSGWRALIPVVYVIGFWIWLSATPGKLVPGLMIINKEGRKLSWKEALIRFLAYVPSSMVFFAGFISIGFDERKQGWHDKIAKTYVVWARGKAPCAPENTACEVKNR